MSEYTFQDLDSQCRINSFTEDISVQRDLQAIRQSITNLVLTRKNERPFALSGAGVGLQDLFFELSSNEMTPKKVYIREEAKRIINRYEPRVKYKDFTITKSPNSHDAINVTISYTVTAFDVDSRLSDEVVDGVSLNLER